MSQNAETPRAESGAFQKNLADGEVAATVAQPTVIVTRGRVEYLAHCPRCDDHHRHTILGTVTAPCGAMYVVQLVEAVTT